MSELIEVLRNATGLRLADDEVMLLRSVGSPNRDNIVSPDHVSSRGFNLLLADRFGSPKFYVKCRLSNSERAIHESAILSCLIKEPEFRASVPNHEIASCLGMQLLILEYVRGPNLAKTVGRKSAAKAVDLWRESLDRISLAAKIVKRSRPTIAPSHPKTVAATLSSICEDHGASVLSRSALQTATGAIDRALSMHPKYQHGDLTGNNIIYAGGQPVFFDFEAFGEVQIPLFDAWHLARNLGSKLSKSKSTTPWWSGKIGDLMLERGIGLDLSPDDIEATLISYLAVMGVMLKNRGVPVEYWTSYLKEVERACHE